MADAGLPCAWAPFEEVTAAMVRKELPLLLSPSTRAQLGERVAFARSALAGEVDGWQYQGSRLRPPSLLPVIPTPDTGDGGAADDAAPCVS